MSKKGRDRRPYIKPVTRVELSEANIKFRWIAIAVLLSVAVVAIGYGFHSALSTEPGWQEIQSQSEEINCGGEFTLSYEFGSGEENPTAEYKRLQTRYSELTAEAYRLFSPEAVGTDNLYHINNHPNEAVTVAPEVYAAVELIVEEGNRHVFLGPVQELYDAVFLSASDAEAALYDPMKEPERAELVRETAAYCASPELVRLEVLGNDQVRLVVAEEYLTFARENGIEIYFDLGWMENAFMADYMADALYREGFTSGYLASCDGFTRNLDSRGVVYSQNIFHRAGNDVFFPGVLEYTGPMSIVSLRDYPMSEEDGWNYYAYEDGTITTVYLDPADGMSKSALDGVTAYSREVGCAQMALKLAPVFIADSFDAYALEILAHEGIQSIRCDENSVVCTEKSGPINLMDPTYQLVISNVE